MINLDVFAYEAVFYIFSSILLGASLIVVLSTKPVVSVMALILAFIASAVLWMQLSAEFLALVLIFVYVGAVMTLFLFVVMMLNVEQLTPSIRIMRFAPAIAGVGVLGLFSLYYFMMGHALGVQDMPAAHYPADYNSTVALGRILYTDYLLPFEIASVILLAAMVSAIGLVFRGRMRRAKSQKISEQIGVQADQRLRVVEIDSDSVS